MTHISQSFSRETENHPDVPFTRRNGGRPPAFAVAGALLAVAFLAAASAGVLTSVGPYLLGVAILLGVLFALGRR